VIEPSRTVTSTVDGVRPRRHRQLSDEAADHVRELIMSGQLRPGEFIRQERIADELNLSATPVREGLLSLRGEGFVQLRPRRGFVVAPLDASDIRDLFTAQALLAGELAARATECLDDSAIGQLEEIDRALNRAARAEDADRVEALNHEFHRSINLAAGAPKLAWVLSVTTRFAPHRFFATIEGWPAASAADHRSILKAFRSRDGEAARKAMHRHVEHAGRLLALHFDSLGGRADHPEGDDLAAG
jgi:DNA-binding GntR family transcriptional regulator